jgi:hypothetical protein
VTPPKDKIKPKNKAKVISEIRLSGGKIVTYIRKGMNEEHDPFTSKKSLMRSPTDNNKIRVISEIEGETRKENIPIMVITVRPSLVKLKR